MLVSFTHHYFTCTSSPSDIQTHTHTLFQTNSYRYWRDNFDLKHILQRDWERLGPLLQGKIHMFVGMSDTYYLNDAVYDPPLIPLLHHTTIDLIPYHNNRYSLEDFLLNQSTSPASGATFDYGSHDGRGYEHCYSGNHGYTLT